MQVFSEKQMILESVLFFVQSVGQTNSIEPQVPSGKVGNCHVIHFELVLVQTTNSSNPGVLPHLEPPDREHPRDPKVEEVSLPTY